MKFLKITGKQGNREFTVWNLLLDTYNIDTFHKLRNEDIKRFMDAYTREDMYENGVKQPNTIKQYIEHGLYAYGRKGSFSSPMTIVARLVNGKIDIYRNLLLNNKNILINNNGGYCLLNDFLEQTNGVIVEQIEKDDIGFPQIESPKNEPILILENGNKMPEEVENYIVKNKINNYAALFNLKQIDLSYIFQSINNADTILINSQFLDLNQIDVFMNAFLKINHSKNVIIFTPNPERITEHELYKQNNLIHKISIKIL